MNNTQENTETENEQEEIIKKILKKRNLDKIIKDLKNKKTPGIDNISNELIKEAWTHIDDS